MRAQAVSAVALISVTCGLFWVALLQHWTLSSQARVLEAATRSNIAPSYGGRSTEGSLILNMTNTGGLPARDVSVAFSEAMLPTDEGVANLCAGAQTQGNTLTVHPHYTVEKHLPVPEPGQSGLTNGRYYVCGSIAYRDDVGQVPPSAFCFSFSAADLTDEDRIGNHDHTICTPPSG